MKPLPIVFFTKNRTAIAELAMAAVTRNLKCGERPLHAIVCDDGSEPGHLQRVERASAIPVTTINVHGRGLSASMNAGLALGYSMSDTVLRMEDDWILEKPVDVGKGVDHVESDAGQVGAVRLGMMFRDTTELLPLSDKSLGLLRLKSRPKRIFNLNNQVALVHQSVYQMIGLYREDLAPQDSEYELAMRFNKATEKGELTPYVCWPCGWATNAYDSPSLFFIHAGKSTLGHKQFTVPERYAKYN